MVGHSMLAWAMLNSLYKQQIWTTLRDLIGQGVYQLPDGAAMLQDLTSCTSVVVFAL
jgi:hypothetical protein